MSLHIIVGSALTIASGIFYPIQKMLVPSSSTRFSRVPSSRQQGSVSVLLLFVVTLLQIITVFGQNYYEDLGVAQDADEGTIKKAYRRLSLKYHPGM